MIQSIGQSLHSLHCMHPLSELIFCCWRLAWPPLRRGKSAWTSGFLWLWLTVSPIATRAETTPSPVLQQAYWQDISAEATLEEARRQTLIPYKGILSRGYSGSAHWIRLTVAPSEEPLGLRITPAWLDSITLYDLAEPQNPITVGDRHPVVHNTLPGLGHSFTLPASQKPRDIWLRLKTSSAHWLNAQVLPLDQVPQAATRQIIWAALYTAVLLLILFVLFAIWWTQRERVLGTYLLRHAAYTCYGSAYLGLPTLLLSDWLPASFFDQAFSLIAVLMLPLSILFDHSFLAGYSPRKPWLAALKLMGLSGAGVVLVMLSGHTRLALELNAYVLMAGVTVILLTALSCQSTPDVEQIMPKRVMVSYYALIFSSLLIGLANVLGWLEAREWTPYALIVHGLISGLMMAAILFVRAQRLARKSQQVSWQLQKARQDMELEQRRRHEQSQFLHMLMHELKTPLSIVTLALGTKNNREENLEHASRAIQDMKAIIDRCVQADQVGQLTLVQHRQAVDLPNLIQQLGHQIPGLAPRLHLNVTPGLPSLQADQQLLQIVLNNLLDNANRYSDPLTLVTVSVQAQAQRGQSGLSLRVGNTPGLAGWPDEQKLFDKYYRAVGAQRESGSGLGLFLSRQLTQTLGGTLDYAPNQQQVEFVLWIPQSPA